MDIDCQGRLLAIEYSSKFHDIYDENSTFANENSLFKTRLCRFSSRHCIGKVWCCGGIPSCYGDCQSHALLFNCKKYSFFNTHLKTIPSQPDRIFLKGKTAPYSFFLRIRAVICILFCIQMFIR